MASAVEPPLVVIVGPTASGKSDVALRLARDFNGEIVAADSRTVYRGLDIGTAKPSREDRALVPHHLLDIADPGSPYTAAQFQADARVAIADIRQRGKVPFLVGGSGLYVDGLLFNYSFGPAADPAFRARLEAMDIDELTDYCEENGIEIPHNARNKRYLIRAVEQCGVNTSKTKVIPRNIIIVGITTVQDVLEKRMRMRAKSMFDRGLTDESLAAGKLYGWDNDPLRAPAYQLAKDLIDKKITTDEAIERLVTADKRLAKKQRTWFGRNEHIRWMDADEVYPFVARALDTYRDRDTLGT